MTAGAWVLVAACAGLGCWAAAARRRLRLRARARGGGAVGERAVSGSASTLPGDPGRHPLDVWDAVQLERTLNEIRRLPEIQIEESLQ